MQKVAALFVFEDGPYADMSGVIPYGIHRNAFTYDGPFPVVAHPPCARWGRYWYGQPGGKRLKKGDDGGMFEFALHQVRTWGGVLEHPRDTSAWAFYGINAPPREGGWVPADEYEWPAGLAWTCAVEQGHYGHLAQKPTWLYYVGHREPPELIWGPSAVARRPGESPRRGMLERLSKRQRALTPVAFRDLLVKLARYSRGG